MTYEIVSILSPKLSDEDVQAEQDALRSLIEKNKGKVLREDTWGKRELAYEIKKFAHGIYVQTDVEIDSSAVAEINLQLRRREHVIRFLIVKKEEGMGMMSDFASEESAEDDEVPVSEGGDTSTPDVLEASTRLAATSSPVSEADMEKAEKKEAEADSDEQSSDADEVSEPKTTIEDLDQKLDDILGEDLEESAE